MAISMSIYSTLHLRPLSDQVALLISHYCRTQWIGKRKKEKETQEKQRRSKDGDFKAIEVDLLQVVEVASYSNA